MWHPGSVDRLKQDARAKDRRGPTAGSARRSASSGSGDAEADSPRVGQYRPARKPAQRVGEDRYRPGSRRTSAEPLAAAWKPKDGGSEKRPAPKKKQSPFGRFVKTYGWRVYALPILAVITVLVAVNTATSSPEAYTALQQRRSRVRRHVLGRDRRWRRHPGEPRAAGESQRAHRRPACGGNFTQTGKGTWHVVPGSSDVVGKAGKLYTYTVEVEDGIDPASYAG